MLRHLRCAMVATTSLVVSIAMFAVASPALAVTHHPKGEFAPFAECPTENAEVEDCVVAKTESGEFTLGKERVPITNPIILQGGLNHLFSGVEQFFAAENGNTLTKSPQKVPGGLLGLVKCNEISNFFERVACEVIFENGVTGVNATTELAAPASSVGVNTINLISQTGTALSLPLKVHLENPLLGSGCYIGSNAHPIVIEFTSGTTSPPGPNKPITGKPGEIKTNESGTILSNTGNELVNNSYPAPAAEGCGGIFSFLIDPLIDSKLSLPSAAGHNTAILRGTLLVTTPGLVKEHE